jgi:hypothetical protein
MKIRLQTSTRPCIRPQILKKVAIATTPAYVRDM